MSDIHSKLPGLDSERLLTVLAQVPPGRVVAFGDLARMAGYPGRARWVGQVLSKLPSTTTLPWHRVVNELEEVKELHQVQYSPQFQ